jgi:endonuclease YncB( thermonuclease family)
MHNYFSRACAVAVLAFWVSSSCAESLAGKVVNVVDGDTVIVLTDGVAQRVRILGIDAPKKGQEYAERSWQNLMQMAYGKDAALECRKVDRYEGKVCKVRVQPMSCPACGYTLDVGLAQLVAGAAWCHRKHASELSDEERGRYESEETEARKRRYGLWKMPNPTRPTAQRE